MSDASFQLPRSSYDELAKIIRAYASAGPEANLEAVSQRAAMHNTIVSRNNKFLIASGILEGGQKKSLTGPGTALARALDFEMPAQIQSAWRSIVESSDFFGRVLSALRIRKGMEIGALRTHIAYTAGEKKSAGVLTGATAIVDILRASGLVRDEDGTIVAVAKPGGAEPVDSDSKSANDTSPRSVQLVPAVYSAPVVHSGIPVTLTIEVQINCTPNDVEDLGTKLKALVDQLAGTNAASESRD